MSVLFLMKCCCQMLVKGLHWPDTFSGEWGVFLSAGKVSIKLKAGETAVQPSGVMFSLKKILMAPSMSLIVTGFSVSTIFMPILLNYTFLGICPFHLKFKNDIVIDCSHLSCFSCIYAHLFIENTFFPSSFDLSCQRCICFKFDQRTNFWLFSLL